MLENVGRKAGAEAACAAVVEELAKHRFPTPRTLVLRVCGPDFPTFIFIIWVSVESDKKN